MGAYTLSTCVLRERFTVRDAAPRGLKPSRYAIRETLGVLGVLGVRGVRGVLCVLCVL